MLAQGSTKSRGEAGGGTGSAEGGKEQYWRNGEANRSIVSYNSYHNNGMKAVHFLLIASSSEYFNKMSVLPSA